MDSADPSDCRDSLRRRGGEEGPLVKEAKEASLSLMARVGLGVGEGKQPAACRSHGS